MQLTEAHFEKMFALERELNERELNERELNERELNESELNESELNESELTRQRNCQPEMNWIFNAISRTP